MYVAADGESAAGETLKSAYLLWQRQTVQLLRMVTYGTGSRRRPTLDQWSLHETAKNQRRRVPWQDRQRLFSMCEDERTLWWPQP
jgi:hypothetical protein